VKVLIRTDASSVIGTGHVSRCLALAEELADAGAEVRFACRELPGNLCHWVEQRGFAVLRIPAVLGEEGEDCRPDEFQPGTDHGARLALDWRADAKACLEAGSVDWVVADHYGLSKNWETAMRRQARHILAIDDLADRPHACDILLDCNLHPDAANRYAGLIPPGCSTLLGPDHALLRRQFREARLRLRRRGTEVRRLLVFFGGTNPHRATEKALEALASLAGAGLETDFLLGANFPEAQAFMEKAALHPWARILRGVEDMAGLLSRADLFLGAGGVTTWERSCMALPSIVAATAENQEDPARILAGEARQIYLGRIEALTPGDIAAGLQDALRNPSALAKLASIGELVDGLGTQRAARAMAELPEAARND